MENSHIYILSISLFLLVLTLAFFSLSETGILSINRYRLKHLSKTSKSAKRVQKLLERPDRLLGVILLGNTFTTIIASSLATILGVEILGEKMGIIVANISTTLILLIFAEIFPKTIAALYPERVAMPASFLLQIILKILYPLVLIVNSASNGLIKLCGISLSQKQSQEITREELRTVVLETSSLIPSKHRKMLLSILDLENVAVDDIMIPRQDVVGLDLDNEWDAILAQLAHTQHTFLPVYKQDLNNIIGVVHSKQTLHLMADPQFNEEKLRNILNDPFFIPHGTSLTNQLINLQRHKQRFAIVVDEYGDILGIITLEDILEEIVGEFTTNISESFTTIQIQEDGSYLVDGSTYIREFNRMSAWKLPTTGDAKTINGLVIEQLQSIPFAGTCCLVAGNIPIEVVQVQDNRIKAIKIFPPIASKKGAPEE